MCGNAEIDIGALRRVRRKPAMTNLLARQRLELYAATYTGSIYPPSNLLEDGAVPGREHYLAMQQRAIEALVERGVI
jgi:hypothetical protein